MTNSTSSFYCSDTMPDRSSLSSSSKSTSIYPPIGVSFLDFTPDSDTSPAQSCQTGKLRTLRKRARLVRPRTAGKDKSSRVVPEPIAKEQTSDESVDLASDTESQEWTFSSSCTSLVSTAPSSLSTGSISLLRSSSPVYDPAPPITPAYLRYFRAESKRSDEHHFGSVASRGTDIAREARWAARMVDLQKRLETEAEEQERESREALEGKSKVGFWRSRRCS